MKLQSASQSSAVLSNVTFAVDTYWVSASCYKTFQNYLPRKNGLRRT